LDFRKLNKIQRREKKPLIRLLRKVPSLHRFLALDNLLGDTGSESEVVRHVTLASAEVSGQLSGLKMVGSACAVIAEPLVRLVAVL
jgi:hypothetical protein